MQDGQEREGREIERKEMNSGITYYRRIFIHFAQELAQARLLLAGLGRLSQLVDLRRKRSGGAFVGTGASLIGAHHDILLDRGV